MNIKQRVQQYLKQGYDINQATSLAMGLPADGPASTAAPAPLAPPLPPPIPAPTTPTGASPRIKLRRSKRDKAGQLGRRSLRRERPPRVNLGGSSASSGGLNTGAL